MKNQSIIQKPHTQGLLIMISTDIKTLDSPTLIALRRIMLKHQGGNV
jgi:hypothetical protein